MLRTLSRLSRSKQMKMIRGSVLLLVLTICGIAVSGCDFSGDVKDVVRDRLENARQKWQDQDIQDYQLVYSQQRGDVIVDTARVFVQSGEVDSIATSPTVDEEELLVGTVESYFNLIEARIDDDNPYGAKFDNDQGFPTEYNADYQGDRRDEDIITIELIGSSTSSP